MALGDFGGGLLAGIQGVQAMSQQRRDNAARDRQMDQTDRSLRLSEYELELSRDRLAENKRQFEITSKQTDRGLAVDEQNADTNKRLADVSEGNLKIAQAEEGRKATDYAEGQKKKELATLVNTGGKLGFVDPTNPSKVDELALAGQLQVRDRNANNFALTILNKGSLPRPEGFEYTEIREVNGKLAVLGKYKDGRQGVLTENGSIRPDDQVVLLDPKTAASMISDEYVNFDVLEAIKGTAGAEYLAMSAVNEADTVAASAQAKVTTTIDAQGNPAASRSFRRVLAAAGSEQEKRQIIRQTAEDLGIDIPAPPEPGDKIIDYTPPEGNSAMSGGMGFDYRVFANGKIQVDGLNGQIAKLESELEEDVNTPQQVQKKQAKIFELQQERDAIIDDRNRKSLNSVEAEIADYENKVSKTRGKSKDYWQGLLDKKIAKRDELRTALGDITPVMQTEAWAQLEANVIDRVDGMTPEEIDAAVDSGELTLTVDQINTMSQRLQEAGVKTIADIAKLPTKEQLASRALLAVVAPDVTARDTARAELANLKETGTTSYSRSSLDQANTDATKARANLINAEANLINAQTNWGNYKKGLTKDARERLGAAAEEAERIFTSMNSRFRPDPDNPQETTTNYRAAIAGFSQDLRNFTAVKAQFADDPEALGIIDGAINAGISEAVASFVNNGPSAGFGATLKSFFLDSPNAQGSDFSLSRVRVNDPQNPTELIYLSYETDASGSRTGEQQGARIKISDLEKVSKSIADYVKKTAVANTANVN